MGQPDLSTEEMREGIRSMLGAMDMSYKDAADEFGINASSLGYILTEKKVIPLYEQVKAKFEARKARDR